MKFTNEMLTNENGWIHANVNNERKFVARCRNASDAKPFMTFLKRNFTIEEYFEMYDNGMAPLEILHTKDYISPNVRKILRHSGFPVNQEGVKMLHKRNVA